MNNFKLKTARACDRVVAEFVRATEAKMLLIYRIVSIGLKRERVLQRSIVESIRSCVQCM